MEFFVSILSIFESGYTLIYASVFNNEPLYSLFKNPRYKDKHVGKHTPLYDSHVKAKAKIVDFAGWDMPLHYGSQIEEHHAVRQHAGIFDVSHMGVVDLHGTDATSYLHYLVANNIDRLTEGKALYTCMLNEKGGVIDDLIIYQIKKDFYRLVINAGTREKDLSWMSMQATSFDVTLTERNDLAMLAIQGPEVKDKVKRFLPPDQAERLTNLKPFTFVMNKELFITRTGYTGEDGYEVILPATEAVKVWDMCLMLGIAPCGLGARDTLRLEAGLNLYGADMDETVTPLESNLTWTVAMDAERHFIGQEALANQSKDGVKQRLVGLVLDGPGIMRNHQKVWIEDNVSGEVTSGGFSPTLGISIALARVPTQIKDRCHVEIRHKLIPAQVIKPPFVRHGKKMF
jgi:aminomethyltransferase